MTAEATKFPVDVALLEKGSVISPDVIEAAYQTKRGLAEYSLKVLRCIDEVYRQLGPRGSGWVIRQRDHGIRVLTDAEASALLASEIDASLRSVGRAHLLQVAVDATQLTAQEAASHNNHVLRGAAFVQAIAATRKKLRQIAAQREPVAIASGDDMRAASTAQAVASAERKALRAAEIAPRSEG